MQNEVTLFQFCRDVWKRVNRDEVMGMAAQLAYFFLLSLFPFLIFLVTLIGYLPLSQDDVINVIRQYAPEETIRLIETNLSGIMNRQNSGLLSFGVIGTIWSASNGINAIIRALNKAYDVKENRSFFVARLMAILLTFAMLVVIIVTLLLPVFGRMIGLFIFKQLGLSSAFFDIWNAIRWILSFGIIVIVLTCLYLFAPNKRLKVKEVLAGAIFATIGWQLVSLVFSFYVDNFGNFSNTYGSIGGIIVLMIWFYLTAVMIILGGEINALLRFYRKRESR